MHRLQEFVRLHRLGTGAREVARLLQMSPNTERSYRLALEAAGLLQGASSPLLPLDALKAAVQAQRRHPHRQLTRRLRSTPGGSRRRRCGSRG